MITDIETNTPSISGAELPAPPWLKLAETGSLMRAATTRPASSAPREQVVEYCDSRARIEFRVAISEELKAFSFWNSRSLSDT